MNAFTLPLALFLAVAVSGMWAFVAVVSWADIRRKEGEAYLPARDHEKGR